MFVGCCKFTLYFPHSCNAIIACFKNANIVLQYFKILLTFRDPPKHLFNIKFWWIRFLGGTCDWIVWEWLPEKWLETTVVVFVRRVLCRNCTKMCLNPIHPSFRPKRHLFVCWYDNNNRLELTRAKHSALNGDKTLLGWYTSCNITIENG